MAQLINNEPNITTISSLLELDIIKGNEHLTSIVTRLIEIDKGLTDDFNNIIALYNDPVLSDSINELNNSLFKLQKSIIEQDCSKLIKVIEDEYRKKEEDYLRRIKELEEEINKMAEDNKGNVEEIIRLQDQLNKLNRELQEVKDKLNMNKAATLDLINNLNAKIKTVDDLIRQKDKQYSELEKRSVEPPLTTLSLAPPTPTIPPPSEAERKQDLGVQYLTIVLKVWNKLMSIKINQDKKEKTIEQNANNMYKVINDSLNGYIKNEPYASSYNQIISIYVGPTTTVQIQNTTINLGFQPFEKILAVLEKMRHDAETIESVIFKEKPDTLSQFIKNDLQYFIDLSTNQETKLKDLLLIALGAVNVMIKLKVAVGQSNDYITIDDNTKTITLDIATGKKQLIQTNCYNAVFPPNYNPRNNNDYIEQSSNTALYKELEPTLNLVKDGYSVIMFGSGYSGAGKTYTLLQAPDSILKTFNKNNPQPTAKHNPPKLFVFEQYGHLTINNDTLIKDIFTNKAQFDQKITIYKYDGTNLRDEDKSKTKKLDQYINDDSYDLLAYEKTLDEIIDQINQLRINTKRIKPTINNPESSRSHIYFILKIDGGPKSGYLTVVDMGGQENPREIFLDYMGNNSETFNNYFNLLFKGKNLPDNFKNQTVDAIFKYYIKKIKVSNFKDLFGKIGSIIENNKLKLDQKWFQSSFKYPAELYLLEYYTSHGYQTTQLNKMYDNIKNKPATIATIFKSLGKEYESYFTNLITLETTISNLRVTVLIILFIFLSATGVI